MINMIVIIVDDCVIGGIRFIISFVFMSFDIICVSFHGIKVKEVVKIRISKGVFTFNVNFSLDAKEAM